MNELVNPLNAGAVLAAIENEAKASNCYALIDCAFDLTITKSLRKLNSISIYQNTELAELEPYTPRLYEIPSAQHESIMGQIIALCQGQPMLSFICTRFSLGSLKQHLEYLLKVYCEDKTEWPLRFADTRILNSLFEALNDEQSTILLAPLEVWLIPDRFAQLHKQLGQNQPAAGWQNSDDVLALDELQFAKMIDAAQPDAILATLRDQYRPMLAPHTPSEQFSHVRQAMGDADEMKLTSHGELLQLAALHLMAVSAPSQSADYLSLKVRVKNGLNLADASAQLPSTFWR